MTDTVERMVWMDTIEAGTTLQWRFYRSFPALMENEWVTVLAVRQEDGVTWAIVVRDNGEQASISQSSHIPVRIQVSVAPESAS